MTAMTGAINPARARWRLAPDKGRPFLPIALAAIIVAALATPAVLLDKSWVAGLDSSPVSSVPSSGDQALAAYGETQLAFVPNRGQTDERISYSAQAAGASFSFTTKEAILTLGDEETVLRLRFLGANAGTTIEGLRQTTAKVNYLIGNEPSAWHTNLPTYEQVAYRDLWPGVDMVFHGARGSLKYEFLVAPGADPSRIGLAYRGAERISLGSGGALRVHTAQGILRDTPPVTYQMIGGERVAVDSRFTVDTGNSYGFALGQHDPMLPMVIDPSLDYSTYLGGGGEEHGQNVVLDSSGNAYYTGYTFSSDFPTTPPHDTSNGGIGDAFITKLDPAGGLVFSTFFGGSDHDRGDGIGLDSAGNIYIGGGTSSPDLPVSATAFDTTYNGPPQSDGYVAKFDPTGVALLYSSYFGGTTSASTHPATAGHLTDNFNRITVDSTGNVYFAGYTATNFPVTPGAFQPAFAGGPYDAIAGIVDTNAVGPASLAYSTFLGGSEEDTAYDVDFDSSGNFYVTGGTGSPNFPTTGFDTSNDGGEGFLTKFDPAGGLVYSTFLGGSDGEAGFSVVVDSSENAYVAGLTTSSDFPTTLGAFDGSFNGGGTDMFVAKVNAAGSGFAYSTYLGGSASDYGGYAPGIDIDIDASGNAYLTGTTFSADFPTTGDALQPSNNGGLDSYVTVLNATGSAPLLYSSYFGGSGHDLGHGIAVGSGGAVYVTGWTESPDFPTTAGAFDGSAKGGPDAYAAKFTITPTPPTPVPATLTLSPPSDTNPVGTNHTVKASVKDAGGQPVPNVVVRFTVTGSVTTSGQCTTDANGECTFTYQGPPLPGSDTINAYADTDGNDSQDTGEPTGSATKTWVLPSSTAGCNVSNGGKLTASNGDKATFGGEAKVSVSGTPSGNETYQDHGPAQRMTVKSTAVSAVVCNGPTADIYGKATINGAGSFDYRIRVEDNGEPGKSDRYEIMLSNGYDSGMQTLEGGNIQVKSS